MMTKMMMTMIMNLLMHGCKGGVKIGVNRGCNWKGEIKGRSTSKKLFRENKSFFIIKVLISRFCFKIDELC